MQRWFGSKGLLGAAMLAVSLMAITSAYAQCPPNTYKKGTKCEACPAGSTSKAGSTSWTDCYCPKNTWIDGSDTCVKCPVGTFSDAESVGAKSVHVKEHCRPLKFKRQFPAKVKSTTLRCAPGTVARGRTCVAIRTTRPIVAPLVPRYVPPGRSAAPAGIAPPAAVIRRQ
jgi:hypothetical protein